MIMKTTMRKVFLAAMVMLTVMMNTAGATDTGTTKATKVINYVGEMDSYPVFQLKLEGAAENEFEVTIRDINSNLLFHENLKGASVSRLYRLDVESEELKDIRFVITNRKTREDREFQVVRNSYTVSDVMVTKL